MEQPVINIIQEYYSKDTDIKRLFAYIAGQGKNKKKKKLPILILVEQIGNMPKQQNK